MPDGSNALLRRTQPFSSNPIKIVGLPRVTLSIQLVLGSASRDRLAPVDAEGLMGLFHFATPGWYWLATR
jgi:hypothetical protein